MHNKRSKVNSHRRRDTHIGSMSTMFQIQ